MPKGVYFRTENQKGEKSNFWKGGKVEVKCQYCSKVRKVFPSVIKNGGGKYCNNKCKSLSQIGIKLSEDHIKKFGKANKGRLFTKEHIRKKSEAQIKYLSFGKQVYKDTSIEIKIENELKGINLNYEKQVTICKVGVVDFFLPEYNVIIECDGDYWHNLPDHKQRDATKDLVWMFNNYKVFRFWEHEINKSPKNCIKAVLRYIKYNRLFQNELKILAK